MSSFNFLAAINGEPIYCNGEKLIHLTYDPNNETWNSGLSPAYAKNGLYLSSNPYKHNLTTDPPKNKVKKTVWVAIGGNYFNGYYPASVAYADKRIADRIFAKEYHIGTYPIEIEVEE